MKALYLALFCLSLPLVPGSKPARAQVPVDRQVFAADPQIVRPPLPPLRRLGFQPVEVREIVAPDLVQVGQEIDFTVRANLLTATLPLRGEWDFGDGHRSTGLGARHAYEKPGAYRVTFTLSNRQSSVTVTDTLVVVARQPQPSVR